MKPLILSITLAVSISLYSQTHYQLYTTTITCSVDKSEMANAGESKIKAAMKAMTQEGRLFDFESSHDTKSKEKVKIVFTVPAESKSRFDEISKEWATKTEKTDAAFFKVYWQTCQRKDSIVNDTKLLYPAIKSLWSPVAVVDGIDEKPDPNMDYDIVFDYTVFNKMEKNGKLDSASINWGISDIGRIYNLHIASGIPKEKIHFVAAVHALAETTFFTNEAYQKKYKTDNPNIPLIQELSKAGVRFLLCGQSLVWMGFKKEMFVPEAKITLTAQTTLSSFQLKGYALKTLSND